ncbi:MAG TPA: rhomboid family intramembrane serine protease [Acidimicrobiia bacterium]|nr:rhomboid family intramembrane serine protease [Acidimicrobiia bacterium]
MIPIRDDNPTRRKAIVTVALIIVNVGIYFGLQYGKSSLDEAKFDYRWAGVPCELHQGGPLSGTEIQTSTCVHDASLGIPALDQQVFPQKNVWLAVIYSMFLHGSILHVLGNMLFLWVFGNNIEDQLGPVWFLVCYLLGGIVASLVHVWGNFNSTVPFLGASGAIAFVMGAYIVWFPKAQVLTLLGYFFVRLPAIVVLGFWFVLQFFTQSDSGVATLAHIGGFAFGALLAFALSRLTDLPRSPYERYS